jgi:glutaredoxin
VALKTFESAAKADPASAEAFEGIGDAYLGMGVNPVSSDPELVDKAIDNLKIALKLDPGSVSSRYKLATGYLTLYDKESALREYELLKGLDKGLADELAARIKKYKAPEKYLLTGSSERTDVSKSAGRGTSATQPKEGRFTGTVELFVVSWCPSCKRAIAYLKSKGIPYRAYDVELDAAAKKRFDDLGGRGYPLILIGSKKFYGSDPKTIDYYVGR